MRQDWGIKESVGPTGWQAVMRQYLRQDRQAALRWQAKAVAHSHCHARRLSPAQKVAIRVIFASLLS